MKFCVLVTAVLLSVIEPLFAAASKSATPVSCMAPRGRMTYKVESRCQSIQVEAVRRTYRLYKPRVVAAKKELPVLLILHGGGGTGSQMEGMTQGQFNRLADKHQFLAVYPDGVGRSWNDGRMDFRAQSVQEGVDDVAFLRALIDRIAEQYPIDRKRIYATGMSNGGLMSYRLACDASDWIAAVAPVAANLSVELAPNCRPQRAMPVLIVNGTDDPVMPWVGGEIKVLMSRRGQILSAQESFERFMKLGDCALPITHNPRNLHPDDGTSLIRHAARECSNGTEVRLYEVLGGGHTWPGGNPAMGERMVGKTSRELVASDEIWSFLSKYSLR